MIYLCIVLYALGVRLMLDNICAQPHKPETIYRGYGFVLLAITIGWPIAVVCDLIAEKAQAIKRLL